MRETKKINERWKEKENETKVIPVAELDQLNSEICSFITEDD